MSFFASQWQRGAAALLSVNTLRFGAAQAPGRRMMHVAAASVAGVTGRRGAACGRAMVGLMRSAPSAPMCSSQLAGKVRYMGIMDSFQQALDTRKEDQISKKKSELFSAQITFISGLDEFQMKDHVTMVQDIAAAMGLTGWKSKMRSSSSQKELLEKYPELLVSEHLSPEDLADPTSIKRKEKRRIATQCGVGVDIVNRFLRSYEANKMLHRFISARKAKGLPLPKTQEEYQKMMASNPAGMRGRDARKSFGRVRGGRAALSRSR